MSTFTVIRQGIWRWNGVDADHGFPIVGYVVAGEGNRLILVDPPGTSGDAEAIRALGRPDAILLTNQWHVRGAGRWATELDIPIATLPSAKDELQEVGASADTWLDEGDRYLTWDVIRLTAEAASEPTFDELAFWQPADRTLIIGDILVAGKAENEIALGPNRFLGISLKKLRPFVERLAELEPQLILSAHLGPQAEAGRLLHNVIEKIG